MANQTSINKELYCGLINEKWENQTITVFGWVNNKRQLGGVTFIDLRDREGILQVVINENFSDLQQVKQISKEDVLMINGKVIKRSNPNPKLLSGQVELIADRIEILAHAENPPFFPENNRDVSEELRFQYRYLDLRNQRLQKNFRLRSNVSLAVRNYMANLGFLEIETPMLTKATPEGARDYLVPSRVYKGKMFALPQSPQLFKQLLMVSGFERYFQIVKCFRDEDLRADRQPEFTQIDIEMSFSNTETLFTIIEGMIAAIFKMNQFVVTPPFKQIPYQEAMQKYGSDKPDLRIPFEIRDFTNQVKNFQSDILNAIIREGGVVKGLVLPNAVSYSRKRIDQLTQWVKDSGGNGLIWIKYAEGVCKSSLKTESGILDALFKELGIGEDNIIFLLAGKADLTLALAGKLREHIGQDMIKPNQLEFLWVTDFPLFFYNEDEKRLDSNHHPFTSPHPNDIEKLNSNPLQARAIAYDLVLNGVEIGGGSKRIHQIELQRKIFQLLNLSDDEINEKFGFFLNALKYGAPPHLGIALGLDRIIMLLAGEQSIREVISFPKTTSSLCLLTNSPSNVSAAQLKELGISFIKN
jgi:aspartyl-tRNA synthetase